GDDGRLSWGTPVTMPAPPIGKTAVPGGVAFSSAEDRLFVTLSRNNTLAVVSLTGTTIQEIPVGMVPYDVLLLSDHKGSVSNWGGRRPGPGEPVYNSSGSNILIDPATGAASSGTVSVVDLDKKSQVKSIPVGLHPSAMVLSPDKGTLYVACANSDVISVINT